MNNSNTASNWPQIPIGKTGQVLGGRQRSPHATGSPQKYLRVANVFDGYIDSSDVFEMPFSEEESKRFLLAPGDILLNEGQSLELVGRSAIYRGDPPDCCFQNTLIRYRANSDVLPEFAQYTFQNFLRLGTFAAIASQTTSIAHLGTGRFAALPMPVPPLDEQRAIASALSDTDALLAKLDQLIAKKRDIKQAAMQELLTGRRRLPGFSDVWRTQKLRDGISLLSGQHVLAEHCNTDEIGCPYITGPSDFQDGKIQHSKFTTSPTTLCQADDILITVKGSGVGTMVMSDGTYCISRQLMAIRVESDWCTQFIHQLLQQDASIIGAAATGLIPGISRSDILNKEIRTPRAAEQTAIAAVLFDMDTEITALEARQEKTRLIKQGMMQELLSGRVRLI
ncbi:restriction endonuclease subunit S [uncultured Sphaerotilus sp.]|uniref:restriction endonuclease subunit S n=1 Tax=uncultured Sphaerotilus sp. TaxID=474984 RepID=UPI0030CA18AB